MLLSPQILTRSRAAVVTSGGGSAEATAFLARTSGLSGNYQTQYTNMISGLVSDGVFAKLDVLYVLATADATTAKLNLIQNNYNATAPNGEPTFVAQTGYTNSSNKYLDSGFDASTATTPKYVQNNACMFNWNSASGQDTGNGAEVGLTTGGGNQMINRTTLDLFSVVLNGSVVTVSNTDASGLWLANRTSSSNVDIYRNGSSFALGNVSASAAVQSGNMSPFVGANFNTTATLKAAGWGSQLSGTDVSNLTSRLTTFFANIP